MKYLLCCFFLTTTNNLNAQSLEQKALDFFLDSVFHTAYRSAKVIEFNGYSRKELSHLGSYHNCLEAGFSLHKVLALSAKEKEGSEILLKVSPIVKIKKNKDQENKRLKMFVFSANVIPGRTFVRIDIYKIHYYTDCWIFEFNDTAQLIKYCKTGAVH